jgi:hypothetical protein
MVKQLDPKSQEYKDMFSEVESSAEFKNMVASNIALGRATDDPNTTNKQQDAASEAQIKATDAFSDKVSQTLEARGYGMGSYRKFSEALDQHGRKLTDAALAALEAGFSISDVMGEEAGKDGKATLCLKTAQNKGQCR